MNPHSDKPAGGPEGHAGDMLRQGEFRWVVHSGGYALRWGRTAVEKPSPWRMGEEEPGPDCEDLEAEAGWGLVRRAEVEECRDENGSLLHWGLNQRQTTPLRDHPALFREFASVDPEDRSAVLAFANRHGLLGRYHPFFFDPPAPEFVEAAPDQYREAFTAWLAGLGPRPCMDDDAWSKIHAVKARAKLPFAHLSVRVCEPLSLWREQISLMHHTVSLWDVLADGSPEISNWVTCSHVGTQRRRDEGDSHRPRPADDIWHWHLRGEPGQGGIYLGYTPLPPDPQTAFRMAAAHVRFVISNQLWRRVQPALLADKTGESPGVGSHLLMFPDDLLAAMWLQFAQAVAGNTRHRQCRQCQKWFAYSDSADARTAKRQFCSDACKSRDYRLRQEAIRLRERGCSDPDIAQKLGVRVTTVAAWLLKAGLHKRPVNGTSAADQNEQPDAE